MIDYLAELDCLVSLSKVASSSPFTMTRPFFSKNNGELIVKGLVHPILATRVLNFVSNDLEFTPESHCYVLTGPNMGGKSTILRNIGLAAILAQIGSFVPAEQMIIFPVDCIFTRLGANDSLIEGKSTFYLEMEEAGKFFLKGTERSLVIFDELGRGTSTEDGSALALATLQTLAKNLKPRTLFTTHYHMILADIHEIPGVDMYHMDSVLDTVNQSVVFLYKLKKGECPKSYGLNVAKLAGIPQKILEVAYNKSSEVENNQKLAIVTAALKKLKLKGVKNPMPYIEEILKNS